eukprot:595740-Alexandrium_andersonii.AAC.1
MPYEDLLNSYTACSHSAQTDPDGAEQARWEFRLFACPCLVAGPRVRPSWCHMSQSGFSWRMPGP